MSLSGFIQQRLDSHLASGTCSTVFRQQLVEMALREAVNIEPVLHEIGCLEGVSPAVRSHTKPSKPLARGPLKGLVHKHYIESGSISSMAHNISNHWTGDRLHKKIAAVWKGKETIDAAAVSELTNGIMKGYLERLEQRQLTGEWIVYAREGNANYYLTLGRHGDDDEIAKRVWLCATEFPHLEFFKSRQA